MRRSLRFLPTHTILLFLDSVVLTKIKPDSFVLRGSFKTVHPSKKMTIAYLQITICLKLSLQNFILCQGLLLFMPLQIQILLWDEGDVILACYFLENIIPGEADLICSIFYLVSKFAGRGLVHCGPPKSSSKSMPCEAIYQPLLDSQNSQNDFEDLTEARKRCLHEKSSSTPANKQPPFSNIQEMTSTRKVPARSLMENRSITRSPLPHQDMRFKDLLKAVYDNIYTPAQRQLDKDGADLLVIDSPQLSPFPRLQQATLRETLPRKISLMGATQEHRDICPLVRVNGSKPPVFPMPQQQKFTIRSMRQFKENSTRFFNKKTKKNFIQLKHIPTTTDVNLPVLRPPYQTTLGKKTEILRLNFA